MSEPYFSYDFEATDGVITLLWYRYGQDTMPELREWFDTATLDNDRYDPEAAELLLFYPAVARLRVPPSLNIRALMHSLCEVCYQALYS